MKKIINFIKKYGGYILIAIMVIAFCVSFAIPLLVAMGRCMWDIAINNPAALC